MCMYMYIIVYIIIWAVNTQGDLFKTEGISLSTQALGNLVFETNNYLEWTGIYLLALILHFRGDRLN